MRILVIIALGCFLIGGASAYKMKVLELNEVPGVSPTMIYSEELEDEYEITIFEEPVNIVLPPDSLQKMITVWDDHYATKKEYEIPRDKSLLGIENLHINLCPRSIRYPLFNAIARGNLVSTLLDNLNSNISHPPISKKDKKSGLISYTKCAIAIYYLNQVLLVCEARGDPIAEREILRDQIKTLAESMRDFEKVFAQS